VKSSARIGGSSINWIDDIRRLPEHRHFVNFDSFEDSLGTCTKISKQCHTIQSIIIALCKKLASVQVRFGRFLQCSTITLPPQSIAIRRQQRGLDISSLSENSVNKNGLTFRYCHRNRWTEPNHFHRLSTTTGDSAGTLLVDLVSLPLPGKNPAAAKGMPSEPPGRGVNLIICRQLAVARRFFLSWRGVTWCYS